VATLAAGCGPKVYKFGAQLAASNTPSAVINDVHYACSDSPSSGTAAVKLSWEARGRTTFEVSDFDPESGVAGQQRSREKVPSRAAREEQIASPTQFTLIADRGGLARFGAPDIERQQIVWLEESSDTIVLGGQSRCENGRLTATLAKHPALFHPRVVISEVRLEESMEEAFQSGSATLVVRHGDAPPVSLTDAAPSSSTFQGQAPSGEWVLEYADTAHSGACSALATNHLLQKLSLEVVVACGSR
jgi:hypothetical protein